MCFPHYYIPDFVSTPTPVIATLGNTSTFNCSATAGQPTWLINGTQLPQLNTLDITVSNVGRTSVLRVPATDKYNNTKMTCVLFILESAALYSDPAVLRVQGNGFQAQLGKPE